MEFQAEVNQLMKLMIHSLYSNKEIFLRELISNASDACDKLRFEAVANDALNEGESELSITVEFNADDHTLTVSDNGIGISEQDIKHVYDRFYRAEKSRSREVGGSGLGLAIVKHILEAHNQNMSLRSTDGKGSTFGFTLSKK